MTNFMTYKGYTASMVFDTEDKIIVGRVQDVDDIISFHGESVSVFESNFHAVIDDYLAASKELGSAPEKPASGKVMLRIAPEVHAAVDGVFEEAAGEGRAAAQAQARAPGVIFHPASGIACEVVAQVQASLRKRILRGFVGRGLLEGFEAKEMLAYRHSGFSVDTSVCIAAHDRAGLERLLRYCAHPPFAMERLRKAGGELVYRCAKQHSEPGHDKRGTQVDEITLTPLELIDRIAALVPPPRTHRHRYFGVLAPHSPHRAAVTEMAQSAAAQPTQPAQVQAEPASTDAGEGALSVGGADGPHLRGVPSGMPDLWRSDAHHRLHHAQRRHPAHLGTHRGGDRAAAHHTRTRAAAVGRVRGAARRGCRRRVRLGRCGPSGTGLRGRSARQLVREGNSGLANAAGRGCAWQC